MKKVFLNNEPYEAPLITLVEVTIEQGFAESLGVEGEEGYFDEEGEGEGEGTGDGW